MPFFLPSSIFLVRLFTVDLDLKVQTDNVKRGRFEKLKRSNTCNQDGLGDKCDDDIDNDGVANDEDNCKEKPNKVGLTPQESIYTSRF